MALLSAHDLSIAFGGDPLLDEVSCTIQASERIGLLGRNGAGKSTFMRLLGGELAPDRGEVRIEAGARRALLPQDVPRQLHGTVEEVVATGAHEIDDEWQAQHRVEQILTRMDLPPSGEFEQLSSGMKRRVLLARALVSEPDVLLLDEPTNHLDIEAVQWLEQYLQRWNGTLLFVTHDRAFLRRLSTRIIEIDRGHLFDWACDYDSFLERKEAWLAVDERRNQLFDKKLAEEESWIRKGIKARRTRNEGRVRALEKMRRERAERRAVVGRVRMSIEEGEKSGKLVAQAKEISFAYGEQPIVQSFSTTILRGDKVGVIGPNGVGKTTLLRLLLGQLAPTSGGVRLGTNLQIAYFDQLREQLDEDATVQENIAGSSDRIPGASGRHVIGYLQDFLFTPERARTPLRVLSGGERNRVLLARLFAKPANVLVMDEPTNDLDTETLELLESRLVEFPGAVLLVSHDREFLNNVVTSSIVFEEDGAKEYVGGYDDWVRQRAETSEDKKSRAVKDARSRTTPETAPGSRKLGYKAKRELASLPETIERLEAEIAELHESMARPEFYQRRGGEVARDRERLAALEAELGTAYRRWEELEG